MSSNSIFTVDVGNTRIKAAFWRQVPDLSQRALADCAPDAEFADRCDDFALFVDWLDSLDLDSVRGRWTISSVNAAKTNALLRVLALRRPADESRVLTLQDVPIPVDYVYPEKLGVDRAVAAYAATRLLPQSVPFLTIDVGTAATIDYVDGAGVFQGGAILPGPRLTAEALQAKTAALPMLADPENSDLHNSRIGSLNLAVDYPAKETSAAIRLGVVYSIVGAATIFYWKIRAKLLCEGGSPERLTIVIAGGDGKATERNFASVFEDLAVAFSSAIPSPPMLVEPRLVLLGLLDIALSRK